MSFGGKNVIDPADYKAVDAAVHRLGGKTIANALVLLVELEVAAAQAANGQPTATAAVSACDDDRTDGDGGSAKKSKGGKPKSVLGLALDTAIASKTEAQIVRLGGSTEVASNLRRVVEEPSHGPWAAAVCC